MAGRKTGDTWLLITSKTRPDVLDPYVAVADHALGNPSWLVGRAVEATGPVGAHVLDWVYAQLAVARSSSRCTSCATWRRERRFPGHHLVRTFLVIGLLGPAIYMIFPVVGPVFTYGTGAFGTGGEQWAMDNLWPHTPTPISPPQPWTYDEITPRNCMPEPAHGVGDGDLHPFPQGPPCPAFRRNVLACRHPLRDAGIRLPLRH